MKLQLENINLITKKNDILIHINVAILGETTAHISKILKFKKPNVLRSKPTSFKHYPNYHN